MTLYSENDHHIAWDLSYNCCRESFVKLYWWFGRFKQQLINWSLRIWNKSIRISDYKHAAALLSINYYCLIVTHANNRNHIDHIQTILFEIFSVHLKQFLCDFLIHLIYLFFVNVLYNLPVKFRNIFFVIFKRFPSIA